MSAALAVFLLLAGGLGWFFLGGRDAAPEPTARRRVSDDVDHAELEQAEQDVRDAADEHSVRDWGPGVSKPPL